MTEALKDYLGLSFTSDLVFWVMAGAVFLICVIGVVTAWVSIRVEAGIRETEERLFHLRLQGVLSLDECVEQARARSAARYLERAGRAEEAAAARRDAS